MFLRQFLTKTCVSFSKSYNLAPLGKRKFFRCRFADDDGTAVLQNGCAQQVRPEIPHDLYPEVLQEGFGDADGRTRTGLAWSMVRRFYPEMWPPIHNLTFLSCRPEMPIGQLVRQLKRGSWRLLPQEFPLLRIWL